jgi:hypothetical protein
VDVKLFGRLVETARQRRTLLYSETGRSRAVIGVLLDEINRHENAEGRPLLSVIVVRADTKKPGDQFWQCATELKRYRPGDDRNAFLEAERHAVWDTWAD